MLEKREQLIGMPMWNIQSSIFETHRLIFGNDLRSWLSSMNFVFLFVFVFNLF